MGNTLPAHFRTMGSPVKDRKHHFLHDFLLETYNGLYFNDLYLPEEVLITILSHLDPKNILNASSVCKRWFNLTRSPSLWMEKYERQYPKKKSKNVDWYVYYALFTDKILDCNLLKNGNGQEGFKHWKIIKNYGDSFVIEATPQGSDPLPEGVEDFNGHSSCFATSYYECDKLQDIVLSPLACHILDEYKPDIYVSEWTAGRFDCGSIYVLMVELYGSDYKKLEKLPSPHQPQRPFRRRRYNPEYHGDSDEEEAAAVKSLMTIEKKSGVQQWEGKAWSKIEVVLRDYPDGVETIVFRHMGQDTQFWKGHYGSKMAGGVVKILFDSLKEKPGKPSVDSQISQEEPRTPDVKSQAQITPPGRSQNGPHSPNPSPR